MANIGGTKNKDMLNSRCPLCTGDGVDPDRAFHDGRVRRSGEIWPKQRAGDRLLRRDLSWNGGRVYCEVLGERTWRMLRGGSWLDDVRFARTPYHHDHEPGYLADNVGFRCVRSLPESGLAMFL